jgi:hypothetical protein
MVCAFSSILSPKVSKIDFLTQISLKKNYPWSEKGTPYIPYECDEQPVMPLQAATAASN